MTVVLACDPGSSGLRAGLSDAAVADRVVILKSGRKVADRPIQGIDAADLARLVMTGGGTGASPRGGGGTGVAETAQSQ